MRRAATLAAAVLVGACGSQAAPATGAPSQLQAQVVASELVVGAQQRVPIGILDHGTPVNDATVHVRAFFLQGTTGVFKGESDAPFKGAGLEGAGVYVARLDLMTAGTWGLDITASRPNGERATLRLSTYADGRPLAVVTTPVVPAVGQPAPMSHNPTIKEADATTIDSGRPPDDMHQISIADAIAQHRPTLVVFASPAFCTSRTCGPEVKAVQSLEPAYRDKLTFIHIEIYRDFVPDPSKRKLAQTVLDWRLQTEPWIFLVDAKGIIQTRFEGATATDELKSALDQLLR
ncbi:MAG: hypothetical protein AUF61_00815 [Chloroflexi bacterium 13_1_20CM_66_33]|nr:MAG: hypothetical protein AUF61_00815 [Chloroflexi bacterium 13_1_20CM_66_33]